MWCSLHEMIHSMLQVAGQGSQDWEEADLEEAQEVTYFTSL